MSLQPISGCHNQITRNHTKIIHVPKQLSHINHVHYHRTKMCKISLRSKICKILLYTNIKSPLKNSFQIAMITMLLATKHFWSYTPYLFPRVQNDLPLDTSRHSLQNLLFHPALPLSTKSTTGRVFSRWSGERIDIFHFRFSAKTGRPQPTPAVPRPFISTFVRFPSRSFLFSFRFPLHIFIRRSFLTINANHLHARSLRGSKTPFAGCRARGASDPHPRGLCNHP